jgi:GrpB-like predicted nucleotidyltransferase (UPF0157 family)
MITPDQQKWINHLSDESKIKIIPFDPTSQEKFEKVRSIILSSLGESTPFVHQGATSMGISGQDEIDTYIPISVDLFEEYISKLGKLFGEPRKIYPGDRAHFITKEDGKRIDVYLINKDSPSWLNGVKFQNYLSTHPDALEEYRILKEAGDGLSVREYYRRKTEFINNILEKYNL